MKRLLTVMAFLLGASPLAQAQPVPPPPPDGYYRPHSDHYYRHGLHNDRYPPSQYYWHPQHGRYYARYYVTTARYARCNDGSVRRASRGACRYHGGVLYYY